MSSLLATQSVKSDKQVCNTVALRQFRNETYRRVLAHFALRHRGHLRNTTWRHGNDITAIKTRTRRVRGITFVSGRRGTGWPRRITDLRGHIIDSFMGCRCPLKDIFQGPLSGRVQDPRIAGHRLPFPQQLRWQVRPHSSVHHPPPPQVRKWPARIAQHLSGTIGT